MAVNLRSKKSSGGILSRLRQDAVAIAYAAIGLFVGLALATYHSSDPSFNSTGSELIAKNACGIVGGFLSDLLYQGFGAGAWLFVVGSVRLSWLTFRGKAGNAFARAAWGFAFIVAASALLSLHFNHQTFLRGQMPIGGVIGALVVRGLVTVFNSMGVAVILWAVVLILAVFYSGRPVIDWLQSLGKGFSVSMSVAGRAIRYTAKLLSGVPLPRPTFRSESKTKEALIKTEPLAARLPSSELRLIEEATYDEPAHEQESQEKPHLIKRRPVKLQAKVNRRVENWKLPDLSILDDPPATHMKIDKREIEEKAEIIVDKLSKFAVNGEVVAAKSGPAVTLFEFRPNADVQLTSITNRADDLALALSAESLRIIAPIPGRDVVGIETSNAHRETVYLKDILADAKFWKEETTLPVCLGREVDGTPRVVDLRSMPHMMVAGQTGSGKSVFVVSSITGLVFRHSPKTLRIVLIDPKQVDLTLFSNIPHLLMPPICEPRKAVIALRWGVREMEKRNRSFNRFKVRKLEEFNEAVAKLSKEQIEEHTQINSDLEAQNRPNETYYYTSQPFIVYVIEEFGDLMMVDKQHVEEGVVRLTQMARAAGIHLILAMQTPRKEIVTGRIKTNIPGRVSFKVPGFLDSKIILDEKGAERLLGRGDMLFLSPGVSKPQRHHAPWLTNEEIEKVVKTWSDQAEPQFDELALKALEGNRESEDPGVFGADSGASNILDDEGHLDEMYDRVLAWVAAQKTVSASLIQRKFGLGYPRASRLVDQFESQGVIGPSNGSKPRQVLIQPMPEP